MRERLAQLSVAISLRAGNQNAQTGAEYLGLLLIVAALIAALIATDPGQAIGEKLSELVRDISGDR